MGHDIAPLLRKNCPKRLVFADFLKYRALFGSYSKKKML